MKNVKCILGGNRALIKSAALILLWLGATASTFAGFVGLGVTGAVPNGLPLDVTWQASSPLEVSPGEGLTLEFPAMERKEGYVPVLAFKGYFYSEAPAGWSAYMAFSLNDTVLDAITGLGSKRLFCRGDKFTYIINGVPGERNWWELSGGKPSLITLSGPGTGEIDGRITSARQEGYNYYLDISDLVHLFWYGPDDRLEGNNTPNSLVFFNALSEEYDDLLHYDDIRVGYVRRSVADFSREEELIEFEEGVLAETLAIGSSTLKVMETGGMVLENVGGRYFFESKFSYPGTETVQYSRLGTASASGSSNWTPVVSASNDVITILAESGNVRLTRTISPDGDHFSVLDHLENIAGQDIGLEVFQVLGVSEMPPAGSFRLSGMESAGESRCAENPTLFLVQENGSIGLVAEDNVFRSQLEVSKRNNVFDFAMRGLGIAAGESCTLEWSIYPQESPEYFAFINNVRNNWGVNYTVDGPSSLFDKDLENPDRAVNIVAYPSSSPYWFEYYDWVFANYTREAYAEGFNTALASNRVINPNVKQLSRLECNLITVDVTTIPGGEAIPTRTSDNRSAGKYGLELTDEQAAPLEGIAWADSMVRGESGNPIIDTYYPQHPYINLLVHPEPGNYRLTEMLEQSNWIMDELGADGIYWDQFIPGNELAGSRYDQWDGHSVVLDEKGNIEKKFYRYALAGASARATIATNILGRGRIMLTNGQPTTRENQALPVFHFQEMENDRIDLRAFIDEKPGIYKWQTMCHLGCPMILGQRIGSASLYGTEDLGRLLTKSIITAMRNGLLYHYYVFTTGDFGLQFPDDTVVGYGPVNHMFPFTPVELGEGILIGEERILTCVSGTYIWPHPEQPNAFHFDCRGLDVATPGITMTQTNGHWEVEVVLDDWNEIAVIEE